MATREREETSPGVVLRKELSRHRSFPRRQSNDTRILNVNVITEYLYLQCVGPKIAYLIMGLLRKKILVYNNVTQWENSMHRSLSFVNGAAHPPPLSIFPSEV